MSARLHDAQEGAGSATWSGWPGGLWLGAYNPEIVLIQEWARRVGMASAGKRVSAGDKQVWEARLSALGLQCAMQSISPQPVMPRTLQRPRKELVDLISEASCLLFGTYMDREVQELCQLVDARALENLLVSRHLEGPSYGGEMTRKKNRMGLQAIREHEGVRRTWLVRQPGRLTLLEYQVAILLISRIIDGTMTELGLTMKDRQPQLSLT